MGCIKSAKLAWVVEGEEKTELTLEYIDTDLETVAIVESVLIEAVSKLNAITKKKLGLR